MNHPFVSQDGRIAVLLTPSEREVLRAVPILLRNSRPEDGDPAWARLRAVGHLDDPGAAARFGDLTAGMLADAQSEDRDRFEQTIEDDLIGPEDAEAWMRAIGEARLRVAARLGIEEDGWEEEPLEAELVEMTVLRVLGYLQESLVGVLGERL